MKIADLNKAITKYTESMEICNQRYGQYLCNEFNIKDDEIFYSDDITEAVNLILKRHVEDN